MPSKTVRIFGASVILAALVVGGLTEVMATRTDSHVELATTATPVTSEADDTTTSMAPDEPFTYRVGLLSGISTDNFWAFYGEEPTVWNSYVLGPTKPALFTQADTGTTLEPELAIAMTTPVPKAGTWTVRVDLRDDLAWSDGVPITAGDLVFTFDTVRRLELGGSWGDAFPSTVASVAADSDHRVVIEFTERPRLSAWPYGVGAAPIMAEHHWRPVVEAVDDSRELYDSSGSGDVGGGPLVLQHASDTEIKSVANPGYGIAPGPDVVTYTVLADEAAAISALEADRIDTILSPRGLESGAPGQSAAIEVVASPSNSVRYLGFNLRREPMSDEGFRKALALLLDREALAAEIAAGPAAWSLIPEANKRWYDASAVAAMARPHAEGIGERLEIAVQVLDDAGYRWESPPSVNADGDLVPGKGLTIDGAAPQPLTILSAGDAYAPARVEYVEAVASVLQDLGFDARPVVTDFDTVVDLVFTPGEDGVHQYDMYVLGWTLGDPALPRHYQALFGKEGVLNNTGYESERFESALLAYEDAVSHPDAKTALWEMERILAEDLPYLPLYTGEILEAYRSDRVRFGQTGLGGIQGRLGGIGDVEPAD